MTHLKIHYKNMAYENMSFIDTGTLYTDEKRDLVFEMENTSDLPMVDISFKTNLPPDSYQILIPSILEPKSRESMILTITNPKKIMYELNEKPFMGFEYFLEKVF